MRKIILKRIQEIREKEGNFSPYSAKWRSFFCGSSNTPLSMYNFDACPDEELIKIFEKIIKIHYKQM